MKNDRMSLGQQVADLPDMRRRAKNLEAMKMRVRRSEAALRSSERKFLRTFDALGDIGHIVDSRLHVISVNQALRQWCGEHGYRAEPLGRTVFEVFPFLPEQVREQYQLAFKSRKVLITEWNIEIKDRDYTFEVRNVPISEGKDIVLVVTIMRDVTALKQAKRELQRMSHQQKQLIKTARHLTESPDVKKVLASIGAGAKEITKAQACAIYLLEDNQRTLTPVVTNDPDYQLEILSTPLKVDGSFTGLAVKSKKGLIFNDAWSNSMGQQIPGTPLEQDERILVVPFIVDDAVVGAMCLNRVANLFTDEDLALAETFASYAASALRSARTYHQLQKEVGERKRAEAELQKSFEKLQRLLEETVNVLISAVEIRDPYTASHQRRVTVLACAIAEEMNLPQEQVDGMRMAALIHDIGKIYVPAEILSRPGRLTDMELSLIKIHPQAGHDVLKMIEFPWPVARIVLQHHERLDGSGFPNGISGNDILLEARVMGVADVVEAMSSHRPYRPAHALKEALEEIEQNKGVLYDAQVVEACVTLFREKGFKFE